MWRTALMMKWWILWGKQARPWLWRSYHRWQSKRASAQWSRNNWLLFPLQSSLDDLSAHDLLWTCQEALTVSIKYMKVRQTWRRRWLKVEATDLNSLLCWHELIGADGIHLNLKRKSHQYKPINMHFCITFLLHCHSLSVGLQISGLTLSHCQELVDSIASFLVMG